MHVRDATPEDYDRIWQLNQAAVPAVGDVSREAIDQLAAMACYLRVVVDDADRAVAFLIALAPGAPYDSINYAWFQERYSSFVYIDRIAVDMGARRRGTGRMLYDDLFAFAQPRATLVTCEVNTRPRNDASLAFHAKLGFEIVGSQDTEGGSKTVALMTRRCEAENG